MEGPRVLPTFRPDAVVDAEYSGFQDNLKKLGEVSGEDVSTGRAI
jgi:glucuronate isomerase